MRTTADRIRHTLLFEIIGLAACAPLASWILDKGLVQVGALSIAISLSAMLLNYVFNLIFDITLVRLCRPVNVRPIWMRVLHATLFEGSLLILTVPLVAWWLDMTLWTAFLTDIGFALFFLIYAFIYNWAYDVVFPMPVQGVVSVGREGNILGRS
ncbi:MAG: PACE efflux transporter [Deltaproteobacteria bacterium]|nr:PACE efflux transporter [Deltaproteobacteria bacterium]